MRIAIGGLMHESNTFADARIDLSAFRAGGLEEGSGIQGRRGEADHEISGFLEGAKRFGFEPLPTLMARTAQAGPVSADTDPELTDRLLERLRAAGLVDAVLLALHGAMVADGQTDADETILSKVRALIDPDRPLVVTLDYHANVSSPMVEASDAPVACRTYPRVDQKMRGGFLASKIAAMAASGQARPVQALSKPPLLIHLLARDSGREPMRGLLAEAERLERTSAILSANILVGLPYSDVAANGPSCVVVADAGPPARRSADKLGQGLWALRHALTVAPPTPEAAVTRALEAETTSVIPVGQGENIGGSLAADNTVLIYEPHRQKATGAVVVLAEPEVVAACGSAGKGNEVRLDAGGKVDRHAPPLSILGKVIALHDGRYVEEQPRQGGLRRDDQGSAAVVELPGENLVVLTTLRHPPFTLGQLTSLGGSTRNRPGSSWSRPPWPAKPPMDRSRAQSLRWTLPARPPRTRRGLPINISAGPSCRSTPPLWWRPTAHERPLGNNPRCRRADGPEARTGGLQPPPDPWQVARGDRERGNPCRLPRMRSHRLRIRQP